MPAPAPPPPHATPFVDGVCSLLEEHLVIASRLFSALMVCWQQAAGRNVAAAPVPRRWYVRSIAHASVASRFRASVAAGYRPAASPPHSQPAPAARLPATPRQRCARQRAVFAQRRVMDGCDVSQTARRREGEISCQCSAQVSPAFAARPHASPAAICQPYGTTRFCTFALPRLDRRQKRYRACRRACLSVFSACQQHTDECEAMIA